MSSPEPIGGFFELEPSPTLDRYPHSELIQLNSGRACFEYALRVGGAKRVHLPKFTCDVMLEPLERLGLPYVFYAIDDRLEISEPPQLKEGDCLVYTNYFGLKDEYSRNLAAEYGRQLILDCSQALFFEPPAGCATFYSPRKFVGLPDGGTLAISRPLEAELQADDSRARYAHLIGRIDNGPQRAYPDFQRNDASLSAEPIKSMSRSTRRALASIDFHRVRSARSSNFARLHQSLGALNEFSLPADPPTSPMVYPFLASDEETRRRLIENQVFVATYWPNVLRWCRPDEREHKFARQLIPLPIDQRYGAAEMDRIAALLRSG